MFIPETVILLSIISTPTGFEIVGQPHPEIHRARESKIWVEKIVQPGYVGVFSSSAIDIKAQLDYIIDGTADQKKRSALSAITLAISNARMVDVSSNAAIHYGYHIEGHKYGKDGYLSATLHNKLLRVPQPRDYSSVFAQVAQAVLTDGDVAFRAAIELLEHLVTHSKDQPLMPDWIEREVVLTQLISIEPAI